MLKSAQPLHTRPELPVATHSNFRPIFALSSSTRTIFLYLGHVNHKKTGLAGNSLKEKRGVSKNIRVTFSIYRRTTNNFVVQLLVKQSVRLSGRTSYPTRSIGGVLLYNFFLFVFFFFLYFSLFLDRVAR